MQVGIKFTISFIWLLGYLVPPQWERDRLLGVHSEHIQKQQTLYVIKKIKGADNQG
jgi:hypothetical protein